MNAEEIDNLFEAFKKFDNKRILKYAGIDVLNDDIEEYVWNNRDEILKKLMAEIEKGDYEYFLQKKENLANKEIFDGLMLFSSFINNLKVRNLNYIASSDSKTDLNIEEIIEVIKDKENRDKIGIARYSFVKLIKLLENPEYIKEIINDRQKVELMGLDKYAIFDLIIGLNDKEFIQSIIENKERREYLGLDRYSFFALVESMESTDYIKKLIENRRKWDELGLNDYDIIYLIKKLGDNAYFKNLIENKEKREKCGFDKNDIFRLLTSIGDSNYLKSIIENKEKRVSIGLGQNDTIFLIRSLQDNNYIKYLVFDQEIKEKVELSNSSAIELIETTKEPEYIKDFLKDKEKLASLGIDIKLVEKIKNDLISMENETDEHRKDQKMIKLPSNMTIGIEIESEGKYSSLIRLIINSNEGKWTAVDDGTLDQGVEVLSPVLKENHNKNSNEIKAICEILNRLGQTTSERCGGHIHIGADYLTTKESWENLLEIWGNTEYILYIICNKEGELPRIGIKDNAKPYSGDLEKLLYRGSVELQDEESLKRLAKKVQKDESRYYSINFQNVGDYKNTIEFRLPNGTINSDVWIENINLFGGILKASEEIALIQLKDENNRTEKERVILEKFEQLKNKEIKDKQKLEILLEIVIPQEYRENYRIRYNVNSNLMKQRPELEHRNLGEIAKQKIEFKNCYSTEQIYDGEDR